jgi:3-phenylpropionate/trans-cinnamate dioxygenase ferredoxin component
MPWIDAIAADDVEEEDVIRWDHDDKTYVIIRSPDDEFYCTAGLCTHEHVHLSDGMVMDNEIECPRHNGIFDYRTGKALRAPACEHLSTYETRKEGDRIFVNVP